MSIVIRYLFDPLCGWCYGATPGVSVFAEAVDVEIELFPTGLFSGDGARAMNAEFAKTSKDVKGVKEKLLDGRAIYAKPLAVLDELRAI